MKKFRLQPSGATEPIEVSLERADAAHDGEWLAGIGDATISFEVERNVLGSGWLRIEGNVHRYYAIRRDGGIDVWLDGATHRLEVVDRARRQGGRSVSATPIDQIVAPMPGTVLKINIAAGDTFEAHQPLVILESMKMEMTLSAPNSGTVGEVRCKVGELVPLGTVLVALEVSEAEDVS